MIDNKINKINKLTAEQEDQGPRSALAGVGSRYSNEPAEAVGSFIRAVSSQAAAPAWAQAQRPQEGRGVGARGGSSENPRPRARPVLSWSLRDAVLR